MRSGVCMCMHAGPASLSKVLKDYTALTGRIPLPPTYALGYQQACYGYVPCPLPLRGPFCPKGMTS